MSRIINLNDLSLDLGEVIAITIHHRFEHNEVRLQNKKRIVYLEHPQTNVLEKHEMHDLISKAYKSFEDARTTYEALILEWQLYKDNKPSRIPLFDSIEQD